jgi:hypothetical protein
MIIFFLILVGVISVSMSAFLWMELSITSNTVDWLEERLDKLEKDAVKVTFSNPLVEGNVKSASKGDTGRTQGPPPKPVKIKKRKPKTVKEWEDEIDIGGHE